MGDLKVDRIQLGQNGTATKNFTFKQGADGTLTLARGNAGATTQDILTVDVNGNIGFKNSGIPVQEVYTSDGAFASSTSTILADDTIPQNTEGGEFMTLSITPTKATNILKIECVLNLGSTIADDLLVACLFKDSEVNARAVAGVSNSQIDTNSEAVLLTYRMVAGTTSTITFKIRAGCQTGAVNFNGAGGTRDYGGVCISSMTITEVTP